jgi:transcriptional regulator with PAS, ATPase and Fis domain
MTDSPEKNTIDLNFGENSAMNDQTAGTTVTPSDENTDAFSGIIGESPELKDSIRIAKHIAPYNFPVLIIGETGTGKEEMARGIHEESKRSGDFVALNSAEDELIESKIFGFVKGAFTGANKPRLGLIKSADKGTLLVDEIGDMQLSVQSKFLRVLQEKEFYPIGSDDAVSVDFRLISATHQNIDSLIQKNRFREDLKFRINAVEIVMPPLRERKGDIRILTNYFLNMLYQSYPSNPIPEIKDEAFEALEKYSWPGNVRELKNVCVKIFALASMDENKKNGVDESFLSSYLPNILKKEQTIPIFQELCPTIYDHKITLKELSEEQIKYTMEQQNGDKIKAAQILGMHHTTLHRNWKKIDVEH